MNDLHGATNQQLRCHNQRPAQCGTEQEAHHVCRVRGEKQEGKKADEVTSPLQLHFAGRKSVSCYTPHQELDGASPGTA